jgi:hypothetical protein
MLLGAQEYYTGVFFGTHNVRGVFDTVNDFLARAGTVACGAARVMERREWVRRKPF